MIAQRLVSDTSSELLQALFAGVDSGELPNGIGIAPDHKLGVFQNLDNIFSLGQSTKCAAPLVHSFCIQIGRRVRVEYQTGIFHHPLLQQKDLEVASSVWQRPHAAHTPFGRLLWTRNFSPAARSSSSISSTESKSDVAL